MSKISVIIPAKNCAGTIERAIKSVLQGVSFDVECVVAVNKSTDNTLEICKGLQEQFPNLVVLDSDAGTVSDARNAALKASTGDIIGFCDGDDYWSNPNKIQMQVDFLDTHPDCVAVSTDYDIADYKELTDFFVKEFISSDVDLLACGFNRVNEEGDVLWTSSLSSLSRGVVSITTSKFKGDIHNNPSLMGTVWNKLYRRSAIGDVLFDGKLTHCEDTDFNLRILKNNSIKVSYVDKVFYNYVQNPLSASNDANKYFDQNDKLKYLYAIEKVRKEYPDDKNLYKETGLKMATLCIDNYRDDLSQGRKASLKKYIKENIRFLALNCFKYEPAENRRRLRKGIRILIKG